MDAAVAAINAIPAAVRPLFLPLVGAVVTLMGIGLAVSIGNKQLRSTISEHFVWLLFGGILAFSGVAIMTGLFGTLGVG